MLTPCVGWNQTRHRMNNRVVVDRARDKGVGELPGDGQPVFPVETGEIEN